ncbi:MAG: peptide ABC transporter substrate-binding protein [Rhodospirillaceae bacterium]|nr:peptide ABC transporter substrate-binding protein [Rhodospirillaceae bacterium]
MTRLSLTRRGLMAATGTVGVASLLAPRFALSQEGSRLIARSYSDLQVLDPAFRLSAPEGDIMECIYTRLVHRVPGDSWEWELDGAESINQIDDTHIEFALRPGIMFTNGFGEMTADDVKFSYERVADPAMESPYADDWAVLDHVEVTGKYTGVIILKEPFVPLWTTTLPTPTSCILSRAAVESVGGRFEAVPPATAGPYNLTSWEPRQMTVLTVNPDWTGRVPDYEEIHILPIEDERTAELGLEAGDLDYTWVAVSSIKRLEEAPPEGTKLVRKPSLAYVWLGMNVEHPPFDDQRVRRAVQHAIDVPLVLDAAYFGAADPATGIIAPGLVGHRDANLYGYDPDRARELLAEAGFADGFDCTIDILNKQERLGVAQAVQALLAEVGIRVTIQQRDSGTFWTLGSEEAGEAWRDIQLLVQRFSMEPDPSWATAWFTPDQIGVWNWERFNSEEFGELHRQGLVEQDTEARDGIYKRMQDLMEESGAYVFLTHESVGVLHRDGVEPALWPNGTPQFTDFKKA